MSYPNLSPLLEAIIYLAKEPVSMRNLQSVARRRTVRGRQKVQELIERYRAQNTASRSAKSPTA